MRGGLVLCDGEDGLELGRVSESGMGGFEASARVGLNLGAYFHLFDIGVRG
jgi:hypothetical protein